MVKYRPLPFVAAPTSLSTCPLFQEPQSFRFFTDPQGAIRVRGTRVLLDTIVTAFRAGATAEEIFQKFPTVALADVYQIIAHYLNHTAEV